MALLSVATVAAAAIAGRAAGEGRIIDAVICVVLALLSLIALGAGTAA